MVFLAYLPLVGFLALEGRGFCLFLAVSASLREDWVFAEFKMKGSSFLDGVSCGSLCFLGITV